MRVAATALLPSQAAPCHATCIAPSGRRAGGCAANPNPNPSPSPSPSPNPNQVDGLVAALPRVFGPVKEELLEKLLAQERRYYLTTTSTH